MNRKFRASRFIGPAGLLTLLLVLVLTGHILCGKRRSGRDNTHSKCHGGNKLCKGIYMADPQERHTRQLGHL